MFRVAHNVFEGVDSTFCVESLVESISTSEKKTEPRSVFIMLDLSGSMHGALPMVKRATQMVVTSLPSNARLWLYTFNDTVKVLFENVQVTADVVIAIERLSVSGSTNTHASFKRLSEAVRQAPSNTQIEIHYFTDGLPTVGPGTYNYLVTDKAIIQGALQIPEEMHAYVGLYGFGEAVDLPFLQSTGQGSTVYSMRTIDDLGKTWGAIMEGMSSMVTKEMRLDWPGMELIFGDRVHRYVSDGQTITTVWHGCNQKGFVSCLDAAGPQVVTHFLGSDAKRKVDQWIKYLAFEAQMNKFEALRNKPEALHLWGEYLAATFPLESLPESMRGLAGPRIEQALDEALHQRPIRMCVANLGYTPLALMRSVSAAQENASAQYVTFMKRV